MFVKCAEDTFRDILRGVVWCEGFRCSAVLANEMIEFGVEELWDFIYAHDWYCRGKASLYIDEGHEVTFTTNSSVWHWPTWIGWKCFTFFIIVDCLWVHSARGINRHAWCASKSSWYLVPYCEWNYRIRIMCHFLKHWGWSMIHDFMPVGSKDANVAWWWSL